MADLTSSVIYVFTFRALSRGYGAHNRATTEANGKLLKNFESTGTVADILMLAYTRFTYSSSNITNASESLTDGLNMSVCNTFVRHIIAVCNWPYIHIESSSHNNRSKLLQLHFTVEAT